MEGRYNLYSQGSSGWTSMRNEEFQEDDVWVVLNERKGLNSKVGTSKEISTLIPRGFPAAARMIPKAHNNNNNNNNPTNEPKIIQQSAPVNVPDWSKIYGKHSKKTSKNASWLDDNDDFDDGDELRRESWEGDEEDDDDDDDCDGISNMMPPHEWIAQKLARSQISSFSVCEGAGRTLKGRDLSRVRNAVLTETGFLE